MKYSLISYHHLGGRGGKFPINIPLQLREGVDMTVYDGDESCIEEAKIKLKDKGFHKINVYPYCISDKEGMETFYVARQPHNSSLLRPNQDVFPYIRMSPKYGAMRLREIYDTYEEIHLKTSLFDLVLDRENMLQPDFISLDIQGKEYEVIDSSRRIFENALLINFEFSFVTQYKEQKNFPEMHSLMIELGFVLIDLKLYDPHHIVRTPIDFEGKGFLFDGEAFYIKNPSVLQNASIEKLLKYCFAAILCEQSHLCVEIFEKEKEKLLSFFNSYTKFSSYVSLIRDLFHAYGSSEKIYLPFFHDSAIYKHYYSKCVSKPIQVKKSISTEGMKISNLYEDILNKYGLSDFAKKIQTQKKINLKTLEHLNPG